MTKVRGNTASVRGFALRRAPEAELVDSAVRGDPAAFAEVYRRFHTPVYAFCLSRLLQPSAAEDAAQEVFVRLLSAEPGSITRPLAWLFGVARHVCIDTSRRQNREIATEFDGRELPDLFDTEGRVTAREDAARIAITLKGLNPRYRTALVMHEMHAQSAAEIAKAFGIGLGATYTLLSRARDSFNAAYTRAEAMSEPCTQAIDILYRSRAGGASETEEVRMQQHLAECDSCSREARRFARSERFAAVRGAFALPVLSRWWTQSQRWMEPVVSRFAPESTHAAAASVTAAATALVLTATLASGPVPRADDQPARVHPTAGAVAHTDHPAAMTPSAERSYLREHERQRASESDASRQSGRAEEKAAAGGTAAGPRAGRTSSPHNTGSSDSRASDEPQRKTAASGPSTARTKQTDVGGAAPEPVAAQAQTRSGSGPSGPTGGAHDAAE